MSRARHLREGRAYARDALSKGAVLTGPLTVSWPIAGTCTDPRRVEIVSRRDLREDFGWDKPINTVLDVRCRKCPACLRARSRHWTLRAQEEIACSQRTWFGTLTLSEANQVKALYRAQLSASRRGIDWRYPVKRSCEDTLQSYERRCDQDRFIRVCRAIAPEVTKWLKRVRKESGAKLRFILVAEAHKSGKPHYHCLIHEVSGSAPIRKRTLQDQWKLGFTQFRLVEEGESRAARYVCKYLTKSAKARVRASVAYGMTSSLVTGPDGPSVNFPLSPNPLEGEKSPEVSLEGD